MILDPLFKVDESECILQGWPEKPATFQVHRLYQKEKAGNGKITWVCSRKYELTILSLISLEFFTFE